MLGREEIEKIIPHRAPMLLVDRITELTEEGAVGELDVREDAMFVQGHFPGNPVMPAVFELEAIAQVGGGCDPVPSGVCGQDGILCVN